MNLSEDLADTFPNAHLLDFLCFRIKLILLHHHSWWRKCQVELRALLIFICLRFRILFIIFSGTRDCGYPTFNNGALRFLTISIDMTGNRALLTLLKAFCNRFKSSLMRAFVKYTRVAPQPTIERANNLGRLHDYPLQFEQVVVADGLECLCWPVQEPVYRGAIDERGVLPEVALEQVSSRAHEQ